MRADEIAGLITVFWLLIWFVALMITIDIVGYTIDDFKFSEAGDFLAGIIAPIALLWFYLGYRQQGEELKHAVEEYKNMVKVQYLKHRPRFEPIQQNSPAFGSISTAGQEQEIIMFHFKVKNMGKPIHNVSLGYPPNSNIKYISLNQPPQLATNDILSIHIQLNERDLEAREIFPENTLISFRYDTEVEEDVEEVFQLKLSNYVGFFLSLVKQKIS